MENNKMLSRLEKFLYAIYSLNVDELPIPLSRIEILWNCLITGDTSAINFEPLSRYEKYLMAMLGLYDLEIQVEQTVLCTENNDVIVDENENYICLGEVTSGGIPTPMSRIEKLLYKLATGDDNLDDIKSFLSRHEELLAEIIRNGGVGGNIDIEYVLYTLSTEFNTLYNTAEKPVKSAILKGNTKYRDIDTGDILDTFDETKNLELVSVKMPVLTTSNEDGTKTNILTVNEDVTLRSNGDVYDELNLLTGRLTQRIDENNEVLAQEVVKTVDLSVVDQDGNDAELSTFNDITHITLSSEGLIPEAELEVATKNEEVLNTLSLEMDDVSTTQTTLEETSNTQSENVDATMLATTEIYEQLL